MKKLKIGFWYWFFYFGSFLEYLGDQMGGRGLDKLDDLTRDDPDVYMYQKKEVGSGNGPNLSNLALLKITRRYPMEIVIALAAIVIGFAIGRILPRERPLGDLRVDRSDPTCEPYLFLELGTDVRNIMSKRHVTFRVKIENFLPHE